MARFSLTPLAQESLRQIALYTEERWGAQQRRRYLKAQDRQFHTLAKTPLKGKLRPEIRSELRSYPEGRHVIYYLIRHDRIVIVQVLHARMDPVRHLPS